MQVLKDYWLIFVFLGLIIFFLILAFGPWTLNDYDEDK
jgi:hypothetical protein